MSYPKSLLKKHVRGPGGKWFARPRVMGTSPASIDFTSWSWPAA